MSRFKRYAHSLASGYVLLGANMLFTLASVPLALRYLSDAEFGLWALTSQIAGYVALVDMGLSASASRILIDYKDRRASGDYGSVIKTGALVGLTQGALVALVGVAVAFVIGPLLAVPEGLARDFTWLLIGQSVLLGASFAARIFAHLLTAHQRYDITNYAQAVLFAGNYGVMWLCFAQGFGVFSNLWGAVFGTVVSIGVNAWGCGQLRLFPARGEWGRFDRQKFRELFAFGRDFFLYSVGMQLVNASQTLLLTRFFGLEVAAIWNVCTRTYLVLTQLITRIFDYSSAALAEMMVRGERALLRRRFQDIVGLSTSLSVVAGGLLAVCNAPFIAVWTSGRIAWHPANDVLLALWLVVNVVVNAHIGLIGQTKRFGFLRFLGFFEGAVFIGLTIAFHRYGGITVMLGISILCTLAFRLPYGLFRSIGYFDQPFAEVVRWHQAMGVLLLWLAPVGTIAWWLTLHLSPVARLIVCGTALGAVGAALLLRFGLPLPLKAEIFARAPLRARPVLRWLRFPSSSEEFRPSP